MGIYVPLIESEYINLQSPNEVGAIGMFQFLPKTGAHFGLSAADLLDVPKSADAAARYLAGSMKTFNNDPMKEALALLSYNRGANNVERDLAAFVNEQNRACSICALTEQATSWTLISGKRMSITYRAFSPPQSSAKTRAFGLQTPPLSSL
jgi:hypothetical protein